MSKSDSPTRGFMADLWQLLDEERGQSRGCVGGGYGGWDRAGGRWRELGEMEIGLRERGIRAIAPVGRLFVHALCTKGHLKEEDEQSFIVRFFFFLFVK
jgi:hypothetical protein